MDQDYERGDVRFIDFAATAAAGGGRGASVAAFARPASTLRAPAAAVRAPGRAERPVLLGESPEVRGVVARIARVAPSGASVMLVGESGTGKEVAAALLHAGSRRAHRPFVAINCSAIPAGLAEAELFGHERGAFTGALRQHEGCFERAAGGTLFLDEITEMPMELQAKLLRVLESGRLQRVGGSEEIAFDVRVIAATNRNPEAAVAEGRLRADLFYRLAVIRVELPPLRQRGDDVGLLAQTFLDRLNGAHGTRKRFAAGALADLRQHAWPGNVRELKNCVERSYLLADDVIEPDLCAVAMPAAGEASGQCVRLAVGVSLAEAERTLLLATLRHCGGNKRRTAEILGVSLKTVYNKLVGYGVDAAPALHTAAIG